MDVTMVCFGRLKDYLPAGAEGNRVHLDLDDDADVRTAVRALGAPKQYVYAVLINGERAESSTKLRQGDEVTLLPPFSGG